ncbi:hypothetical protein JKP88DRAFT_244963 [Tribonema minus]|uniref:Uncharacterized protein n=1 Tax=Tribonema minus TaxID=303371 RepID=A0A835Z0H5_9STRA|nr:hypothetical protein JKP88DRAFT_244963 [Tribonema minus]
MAEMQALLRVQSDLFALMYRYTTSAVHGVFYEMYSKLSKMHDNDEDVCSHLQWSILRTHLWSAKIVSTVAAPWSRIARDCIVLVKKLAKCNVKILALSGFTDADDELVDIHVTFPEILHAVLTSASRVVSNNLHCIMSTDTSQIANLLRQHHVVEDAVANLCKDHVVEATPEAVKLRSMSQRLESEYKRREEELERKERERLEQLQKEKEQYAADAIAREKRMEAEMQARFELEMAKLRQAAAQTRRTQSYEQSYERSPTRISDEGSDWALVRSVDENRRRHSDMGRSPPRRDDTRRTDMAAHAGVDSTAIDLPEVSVHAPASVIPGPAVSQTDAEVQAEPEQAVVEIAECLPGAETVSEALAVTPTHADGAPDLADAAEVPQQAATNIKDDEPVPVLPTDQAGEAVNAGEAAGGSAIEEVKVDVSEKQDADDAPSVADAHADEHSPVAPPNSPPVLADGGADNHVKLPADMEEYIAQRIQQGIAQQQGFAAQGRGGRRATQISNESKVVSVPSESEYERLKTRYLHDDSDSDLDVDYL